MLIFNVLSQGSNVYRPNGRTSNATTTATDKIGYNDLTALHANLMDKGGRGFDDGDYVFVVPPQVYAAMLQDQPIMALVA